MEEEVELIEEALSASSEVASSSSKDNNTKEAEDIKGAHRGTIFFKQNSSKLMLQSPKLVTTSSPPR